MRRGRLATIGVVAFAGLALAARARRTRQIVAGPISSVRRAGRAAVLGRLGARTAGAAVIHRARRTFADAERKEQLDAELQLRTAEQVAEALGNMKGALMKLGQMVSYVAEGLPEPVREALAQLQQDAPPMSAELAAQVVREELGAAPEEVFATWDPVPVAAASIGQVHRAITRDGRAVAVKVQYPGVAEAIESDLATAGVLFAGAGMLFPGLESGPVVEELRARIVEEVDYRLEAENQGLFADCYRGHPFIHVPDVVGELSTGKVLTTELATGERFDDVLRWPQDEQDLVAEIIFRFVFRSLYRLHVFNGDPHPGNYLFRRGGHGEPPSVTFLDFGLVKRFAPAEVDLLAEMVQTMVLTPDAARFRAACERAGFLQPGAKVTDDQAMDYLGHFYELVREDRAWTIDEEYAAETVRRFFTLEGSHGEVVKSSNVPPAFVIIQRINLGMYAILGRLRATANWRRIAEELWPFVAGPPSTELGKAEAEWLAAKGDG